MTYLVHTAHAQLCALWAGCVGWTLTAVALGLIPWRIWQVSDRQVITSGEAWVGLWRTCFNSHTLVSPGFMATHCKYISITDAFTPPEIAAGQVLMLLSLLVGFCGNAGGVYALRNIYFGMKDSPIRLLCFLAGGLSLLSAAASLIPLLWNMSSVVTNQTIKFPPDFKMPPAPEAQYVGSGIGVGMVGAVLMAVSGIVFCSYRLPVSARASLRHGVNMDDSSAAGSGTLTVMRGRDNPAFQFHEHL